MLGSIREKSESAPKPINLSSQTNGLGFPVSHRRNKKHNENVTTSNKSNNIQISNETKYQNNLNDDDNTRKILSMSHAERSEAIKEIQSTFSKSSIDYLLKSAQLKTNIAQQTPSVNQSTVGSIDVQPYDIVGLSGSKNIDTTQDSTTKAGMILLNQSLPNTFDELQSAIMSAPPDIQKTLEWTMPKNTTNPSQKQSTLLSKSKLETRNSRTQQKTNISANTTVDSSINNISNLDNLDTNLSDFNSTSASSSSIKNLSNKTKSNNSNIPSSSFRLNSDRFDLYGIKVVDINTIKIQISHQISTTLSSFLSFEDITTIVNACIQSMLSIQFLTPPPNRDSDEYQLQPQHELYNHQYEPDQPGYTIHEIYEMFRSESPYQHEIAITMLHGILIRRDMMTSIEAYYNTAFHTNTSSSSSEDDSSILPSSDTKNSIDSNNSHITQNIENVSKEIQMINLSEDQLWVSLQYHFQSLMTLISSLLLRSHHVQLSKENNKNEITTTTSTTSTTVDNDDSCCIHPSVTSPLPSLHETILTTNNADTQSLSINYTALARLLAFVLSYTTISDFPLETPTLLLWAAIHRSSSMKIKTKVYTTILSFLRSKYEYQISEITMYGEYSIYHHPILPTPHSRRHEKTYEEYIQNNYENHIESLHLMEEQAENRQYNVPNMSNVMSKFAISCRWSRVDSFSEVIEFINHYNATITDGVKLYIQLLDTCYHSYMKKMTTAANVEKDSTNKPQNTDNSSTKFTHHKIHVEELLILNSCNTCLESYYHILLNAYNAHTFDTIFSFIQKIWVYMDKMLIKIHELQHILSIEYIHEIQNSQLYDKSMKCIAIFWGILCTLSSTNKSYFEWIVTQSIHNQPVVDYINTTLLHSITCIQFNISTLLLPCCVYEITSPSSTSSIQYQGYISLFSSFTNTTGATTTTPIIDSDSMNNTHKDLKSSMKSINIASLCDMCYIIKMIRLCRIGVTYGYIPCIVLIKTVLQIYIESSHKNTMEIQESLNAIGIQSTPLHSRVNLLLRVLHMKEDSSINHTLNTNKNTDNSLSTYDNINIHTQISCEIYHLLLDSLKVITINLNTWTRSYQDFIITQDCNPNNEPNNSTNENTNNLMNATAAASSSTNYSNEERIKLLSSWLNTQSPHLLSYIQESIEIIQYVLKLIQPWIIHFDTLWLSFISNTDSLSGTNNTGSTDSSSSTSIFEYCIQQLSHIILRCIVTCLCSSINSYSDSDSDSDSEKDQNTMNAIKKFEEDSSSIEVSTQIPFQNSSNSYSVDNSTDNLSNGIQNDDMSPSHSRDKSIPSLTKLNLFPSSLCYTVLQFISLFHELGNQLVDYSTYSTQYSRWELILHLSTLSYQLYTDINNTVLLPYRQILQATDIHQLISISTNIQKFNNSFINMHFGPNDNSIIEWLRAEFYFIRYVYITNIKELINLNVDTIIYQYTNKQPAYPNSSIENKTSVEAFEISSNVSIDTTTKMTKVTSIWDNILPISLVLIWNKVFTDYHIQTLDDTLTHIKYLSYHKQITVASGLLKWKTYHKLQYQALCLLYNLCHYARQHLLSRQIVISWILRVSEVLTVFPDCLYELLDFIIHSSQNEDNCRTDAGEFNTIPQVILEKVCALIHLKIEDKSQTNPNEATSPAPSSSSYLNPICTLNKINTRYLTNITNHSATNNTHSMTKKSISDENSMYTLELPYNSIHTWLHMNPTPSHIHLSTHHNGIYGWWIYILMELHDMSLHYWISQLNDCTNVFYSYMIQEDYLPHMLYVLLTLLTPEQCHRWFIPYTQANTQKSELRDPPEFDIEKYTQPVPELPENYIHLFMIIYHAFQQYPTDTQAKIVHKLVQIIHEKNPATTLRSHTNPAHNIVHVHHDHLTIKSTAVSEESMLTLCEKLMNTCMCEQIDSHVHRLSLLVLVHPSMPWRIQEYIWNQLNESRIIHVLDIDFNSMIQCHIQIPIDIVSSCIHTQETVSNTQSSSASLNTQTQYVDDITKLDSLSTYTSVLYKDICYPNNALLASYSTTTGSPDISTSSHVTHISRSRGYTYTIHKSVVSSIWKTLHNLRDITRDIDMNICRLGVQYIQHYIITKYEVLNTKTLNQFINTEMIDCKEKNEIIINKILTLD